MTTEERIIHSLINSTGYVSGEDLAGRLRVSRTAVWSHVRNLKMKGFVIESLPHLGYRLARRPDKLMPVLIRCRLGTAVIGNKIYHYETIGSTNTEALRLARAGAEEGTVVISEAQSSGRGRLGRSWFSPPSKGIYLSVILKPPISPVKTPFLTLWAAIAATEAVRRCSHLTAFVKWPNDVVINGRKLCGILTELDTEADRINHAVVGVGINVNHGEEDLPEGVRATSIFLEKGEEDSRLDLVRHLLVEMDSTYHLIRGGNFNAIIDRWLDLSSTVGERIAVETVAGRRWEGIATGLDDDGCLLLRLDNGMTQRVTGGDVTTV